MNDEWLTAFQPCLTYHATDDMFNGCDYTEACPELFDLPLQHQSLHELYSPLVHANLTIAEYAPSSQATSINEAEHLVWDNIDKYIDYPETASNNDLDFLWTEPARETATLSVGGLGSDSYNEEIKSDPTLAAKSPSHCCCGNEGSGLKR